MKTHFSPILCVIKPPAMGPTTGPANVLRKIYIVREDDLPISGPREYRDIAPALSRSEKRSPTLPPPIATGADPAKPAAMQPNGRFRGNKKVIKKLTKKAESEECIYAR